MRKPRQGGSSSIEPEAEAKRAHRGSSRKATLEAPPNLAGGRKIRCAIYTRKSSEEGLEQEFNSLDAQREACEAFVRSQKHEGWSVLPQLYDDPGYSGGTMERPALKRLLADIAAHRIDAVVVYKVDRLTRSLSDFAKIVEVFDAHSVSFVSITQAFNTTTSMGRLTLNVLLSFAQFEREVTGERIRDKIAASKRKGLWMGGQPSLGYDVRDRKLVVNEAEAAIVRMIFRRYLELGSVRVLKAALDEEGVVSKQRTAADGSPYGGKSFSRGALYLMLQNRIYRGEIVHKGAAYRGEHAPIIEEDLWSSVQLRLEANGVERREAQAPARSNLLIGHALRRGRAAHDADPRDQEGRSISVLCVAPPRHRDKERGRKWPSLRPTHSGGQSGRSCRSASAIVLRRSGRRHRISAATSARRAVAEAGDRGDNGNR